MADNFLTADEAVHDLTLALMYLNRISDSPKPDHYWDEKSFRTSTSFDSEILSWLEEVGFVSLREPDSQNPRTTITPAGVHRAKEILEKLKIKDWDREEITKKEHS
ncbi:MAG: hypothetical protein IJQ99_05505 [Synergistaceae bacterium]|nr:hypothetical protein [Synergistaceae bacterium]